MKIRRQHLIDLPRCYAVSALNVYGRLHYVFASELDEPCYAFDAETLKRHTVWEKPGGTMAIIPLRERDGEFLAVQNFKPKMMAPDTEIVWARPKREGGWNVSTLAKTGYIHRIDVLRGDREYLLVCTIASHKDSFEDWSCPGKLWAAPLPSDLHCEITLEPILEGLTRNHGYWHSSVDGKDVGYMSSDEGVKRVTPPQFEGDSWHFETILQRRVSDIAFVDVDNDGERELATIEPLHGDSFIVNKKVGEQWMPVYRYQGDFKLGHVVWGGTLRGVPGFIGGSREGAGDLFFLQQDTDTAEGLKCTVIDSGRGPANVFVINGAEEDVLLVSNREIGEAAIYYVSD